jgi:predicted TIM-barrel fold metal-dependent hydrolase
MFVDRSKINHAVIVHPEPYQDDHRYLEHCLKNEPSPGFFKGTCLFDPIAPDTPDRLEELFQRFPSRIVAFRIHEMGERGSAPETSGAIKNRDLRTAGMKNTWHKCHELGLAVQMHFLPHYATQIFDLASQFQGVTLILDHLGRAGQGTPAEFQDVLRLASLPRTSMKLSGVNYSSQQDPPHADAKPTVRKILDAFGTDRILWGGLGQSMDQFEQQIRIFDTQLADLSEADRTKIRGLNAVKLFGFAS